MIIPNPAPSNNPDPRAVNLDIEDPKVTQHGGISTPDQDDVLESAKNKGNIPVANDDAAKRADITTKVVNPDMFTAAFRSRSPCWSSES